MTLEFWVVVLLPIMVNAAVVSFWAGRISARLDALEVWRNEQVQRQLYESAAVAGK